MCAVEDMMCAVCEGVTEGHNGDVFDFALTLCRYDFRKGDLFVLSGMGRFQFSNLFTECQFPHRRMESLEHFFKYALYIYI